MEENETPDPEYLKGFNEGYTLSKHLPDLAEKIIPSIGNSLRGTGFAQGRQEYLLELRREKYPAWRKNSQINRTDEPQVRDMDKEIDAPEPDF